ncbi:MAG: DUF1559 domain-containing protein [Verrucomicrobiae bacterium]|nr:DUF1559 domain-containing protein [Verrucomicrobiae bacterium]
MVKIKKPPAPDKSRRATQASSIKIQKNAFTIIELLVVTCTISILCALLTPALRAARDKAKSIQCMGNLKQIGLAAMLYAESNNERLPDPGQGTGFHQRLWIYAGYQGTPPTTTGGEKAARIFHCPADKVVRDVVDSPPRSYSMNVGLSPYSVNDPSILRGPVSKDGVCSLADIPDPSNTILVMEYHNTFNRFANYSCSAINGYRSSRVTNIFHNGGANYLFVDGHVAWVMPADYLQRWATISSDD